eukprot:TRINITY_DN22606_c0_g1_i1.p1 TRINITY_DN22606_c0_g1~~TRINITY_DN22606_c0_g1_i1.p1  ORF type:complete len:131 (-),score=14.61 TRINITY_DN22606_c0_g1_i1:10-402(-)
MIGISEKKEQNGQEGTTSYEHLYRTPMLKSFDLGALYNIHMEELYQEKNVWTLAEWESCGARCKKHNPGVLDTTKYMFSHSTDQKLDVFDINGNAKLSMMFGVAKASTSLAFGYMQQSSSKTDQLRYSFT